MAFGIALQTTRPAQDENWRAEESFYSPSRRIFPALADRRFV
jgi:hypothetical protein